MKIQPAPFGPPGHEDWPGLRAWANRLLREARARGAADAELRAIVSVAALWEALAERHDQPPRVRATRAEIRLCLDTIAAQAREPAIASALRTLAWWHHPMTGSATDCPRILHVMLANIEIRAKRGTTQQGGSHVDRSAERAPKQQAAARPARAAATQPGLL